MLHGRSIGSSLKPFGLVLLRKGSHEYLRDIRAASPNHSLQADPPLRAGRPELKRWGHFIYPGTPLKRVMDLRRLT